MVWNQSGLIGAPPTTADTRDSQVPEFMDRYSQPRPILYMRATVGGTTVPAKGSTALYDNDNAQYDFHHLMPYQRRAAGDFPGDFFLTTGTGPQQWTDYLRNPSNKDLPRGKDTFILISAGPDRVYGTSDDLFSGQ